MKHTQDPFTYLARAGLYRNDPEEEAAVLATDLVVETPTGPITIRGTAIQDEIIMEELPGMWESADFTGGWSDVDSDPYDQDNDRADG